MEDKEKKNVVSAGDNLTDYMETVIADLEKKGNFRQHMFTGAYCALLPVLEYPCIDAKWSDISAERPCTDTGCLYTGATEGVWDMANGMWMQSEHYFHLHAHASGSL